MKALKSLLTLILVICVNGMRAQQLHLPEQVDQYMKNSAIQYQMDSLIIAKDSISFPLVEKGYFLLTNGSEDQLVKKDFSQANDVNKNLQKATDDFD